MKRISTNPKIDDALSNPYYSDRLLLIIGAINSPIKEPELNLKKVISSKITKLKPYLNINLVSLDIQVLKNLKWSEHNK